MKNPAIILVFLLGLSACNLSPTIASKHPQTPGNETENSRKINDNTNVNKSVQLPRTQTKYPLVFVGAINIENEKANAFENQVWSLGEDENRYADGEPTFETNKDEVIEVDIMNCAGYLGAGKATYDSGNGLNWKIKFIPETIAADAVEKVKQCNTSSDDDYIQSNAFAIAPQNANRRNIKIAKVDTRRLFESLPKETKKWLNNKYGLDIRKKDDLSLKNDNWTDTDGDGKIDLIFVFTNYDVEHSGGEIMMLVGGKWKDMGSVRD